MKIKSGAPALPQTNVGKAAASTIEQLKQASPGKSVGIAAHFDALADNEELNLGKRDLVDAAVLALAQLQEPQSVVDGVIAEVAAALKKPAAEIAQKIADNLAALADAPTVSDSQLGRAMRPSADSLQVPSAEVNRTQHPFGQMKDLKPDEYKRVVGDLAAEVKAKWGEQSLNEPLVKYFVKRFEVLTGVHIARADSVAALLRDFGDAFRALFEREMPITMVAGGSDADRQAVRDLMKGVYDELDKRGLKNRVSQIGRYGAGGAAHEASFEVLERVGDVDRIGIAAATKEALTGPPSVVDKLTLFGKNVADETWITRELARRGVAIVLGGDQQSLDEAKDVLARNPHRVFVCDGLGLTGELGKVLGGIEGATHLPDAKAHPVEAGRKIGALIADMIEKEQHELLADPLLKAAFQMSAGQLTDAVQHLQQNASQNRISRIITAVGNRLERAGVPSQEIWQEVSLLARELSSRVLYVDNFKDNALWQKLAKEAFSAVGGNIAKLIDDASVDVYFASWTGIKRKAEKPSFFEENVSEMPKAPQDFDYTAPHTMLDLAKYCYIRLDKPIADVLVRATAGEPTLRPEVFLGTEKEMADFYTAKGFTTSYNAFDSNGTQYLMFKRGDVVKPVLFGIDSPARLTQVSALLEQAGVDTKKMVVRGKLDDVRLNAQNALMAELGTDERPIAGAVINNTSEARAALAALAGVNADDIQTTSTHTVGPFRYDVLEVKPEGADAPMRLLCFKPAYGELTLDLQNALLAVGCRNFLFGGAAGSLVNDDAELGAMHRVTKIQYGDKNVDLRAAGLELMAPVAGVTHDVTNVFHPSPVLQSAQWADETRTTLGKADVDQETAAGLFALTEALRKRNRDSLKPGEVLVDEPIFVSTMLHQSDVVGKGFLELGTVDSNYAPNVRTNVTAWLKELGVGEVRTKDAKWNHVAGAAAGRLQKQAPRIDLKDVKVPAPDMSSIGTSSEYSHIDQFKGQKRCIVLDTNNPTTKDKQLLEKMLERLDKSQYWIVVSQNDPNHGEMLKLADKLKFETLCLTTKQAAMDDKLLGTPTFTMFFDDDKAIAAAKVELTTKGTKYEWEENDAQHWHIHVGDYKLDATPPENQVYTSRITRERDAQLVGDKIRSELDDKRAMVEDGLIAWAKGAWNARPNETLFELSVRFGFTDPRGALVDALLPELRKLVGKADATAKEVKQLATEQKNALVLDVLKATNTWPDNAAVADKLAAFAKACAAIEKMAAAAKNPALASIAARARVHDLANHLATLNPTLATGAAATTAPGASSLAPATATGTATTATAAAMTLAEGAAVKLRQGEARAAPNMVSPSFVKDVLDGRKPFLITGASAKSWPLMSPEDRAHIVKMLQVLGKVLDKDKVSVWTGVTAFGVEKYAQEIFGKAGFQLMGVGTENTLKDLKDVSPHLTDVMLLGINWFGKSRPVISLVEDLGGDVLAVGGGAILLAEILVSVAMGARTHLLSGIGLSDAGQKEQVNLLLKKLDKQVASSGEHKPALEKGIADARAALAANDLPAIAAAFDEMAATAKQMGTDTALGVAASSELAPAMKANAFAEIGVLLDRLGIDRALVTPDMISKDVDAELIRQVIDVNKEAAAMARYQKTT